MGLDNVTAIPSDVLTLRLPPYTELTLRFKF